MYTHTTPHFAEADNFEDFGSAEESAKMERLVLFPHFSLPSLDCTLNLTNAVQSKEQAEGKMFG